MGGKDDDWWGFNLKHFWKRNQDRKMRMPNLLSGLQGKSQVVHDDLSRLGEQMVHSSEGKRALARELCYELDDKFLQHGLNSGIGQTKTCYLSYTVL